MKNDNMKTMKRPLALLMVVVILVAMIPATIGAVAGGADPHKNCNHDASEASKCQITGNGGTLYYDGKGLADDKNVFHGVQVSCMNDAAVSVSKTIAATSKENEFEITLQVKTTEKVEDTQLSPNTAVVLTIDISSSMTYNEAGYSTPDVTLRRMNIAKTAAKEFIDEYAESAYGADRYLSIVVFGLTAKVIQPWVDVADAVNLNAAKSQIDLIRDTNATNPGYYPLEDGTFMQGGLLVSRNLYNKAAFLARTGEALPDNRFVVLITDGNPNCWTTDDSSIDNYMKESYKINNPGGAVEDVNGWSAARKHVPAVAEQIRNGTDDTASAKLYTIAYNTGDTPFGRPPEEGTAAEWLKNRVAYNETYAFTSTNNLTDVFKTINHNIKRWAEAWVVSDPMGANIIYTGNATGGETQNPKLVIEDGVETLKWNLKENGSGNYDKETGITTFTYHYTILLNTLANGFVAGKSYATNGTTTLTYVVNIAETGQPIKYGEPILAAFKVPKVKGYKSSLAFTKVDPYGNALSGAEFTITHDTKNCRCAVVGDDFNIIATVSGDNANIITFDKIPSGHKLLLNETKAPAGYEAVTGHVLSVKFGALSGTDTGRFGSTDDGLTFTNYPETYTIDVTKKIVGASDDDELKAGDEFSFEFILSTNSATPIVVTPETLVFDRSDLDNLGTSKTKSFSIDRTNVTLPITLYLKEIITNKSAGSWSSDYAGEAPVEYATINADHTITYHNKNGSVVTNTFAQTPMPYYINIDKSFVLNSNFNEDDGAELFCGPECGHVHDDSCYGAYDHEESAAIAGHIHGDDCYERTLNCPYMAHEHGASCETITWGALKCGMDIGDGAVPGHSHENDGCLLDEESGMWDCGLEEGDGEIAGHEHSAYCYDFTVEITCGYEAHKHNAECFNSSLICTQAESGTAAHIHDSTCVRELTCTIVPSEHNLLTCYGYTFTFVLRDKGNNVVDTEYVSVTRAKLMELSAKEESVTVTLTIPVEKLDDYPFSVTEEPTVKGWSLDEGFPIAKVPPLGGANVEEVYTVQVENVYGGARVPSIRIFKYVQNLRNKDVNKTLADYNKPFYFGLFDANGKEPLLDDNGNPAIIEVPVKNGMGNSGLVKLIDYIGVNATTTITLKELKELPGKAIEDSEVTYTDKTYEIVIVDGEIDPAENYNFTFFNGFYKDEQPEFTLMKEVIGGKDDTFYFDVIRNQTPLDPITATTAGGSYERQVKLPTNFSGTLEIRENDSKKPAYWEYDKHVYSLEYSEGRLVSAYVWCECGEEDCLEAERKLIEAFTTAAFTNKYTPPPPTPPGPTPPADSPRTNSPRTFRSRPRPRPHSSCPLADSR